MSERELPPLPEPDRVETLPYSERFDGTFDEVRYYSEEKLRAYGDARIAAAIAAINAHITEGPLPGDGFDKTDRI